MSDLISREHAIDAVEFGITYARAFNKETGEVKELFKESNDELRKAVERIRQLPPILPCEDKVSDLLYHIYSIQSPHLDMCGVIAKKYYCQELWKELFGKESELPGWMT